MPGPQTADAPGAMGSRVAGPSGAAPASATPPAPVATVSADEAAALAAIIEGLRSSGLLAPRPGAAAPAAHPRGRSCSRSPRGAARGATLQVGQTWDAQVAQDAPRRAEAGGSPPESRRPRGARP